MMDDALKAEIERKRPPAGGFIKTGESPLTELTSEQKALLNRKGNVFFNEGDFDKARRIFLSTGYSDGLTRIGDRFFSDHKELEALKYYLLAHNARRAEPLIQKTAGIISILLKE